MFTHIHVLAHSEHSYTNHITHSCPHSCTHKQSLHSHSHFIFALIFTPLGSLLYMCTLRFTPSLIHNHTDNHISPSNNLHEHMCTLMPLYSHSLPHLHRCTLKFMPAHMVCVHTHLHSCSPLSAQILSYSHVHSILHPHFRFFTFLHLHPPLYTQIATIMITLVLAPLHSLMHIRVHMLIVMCTHVYTYALVRIYPHISNHTHFRVMSTPAHTSTIS